MSDLKLYYFDLPVGTIRGAFENDGIWYGTIDLDLAAPTNPSG